MKTMINGYVSVAEAAKLLEVDPSQVRRYCLGDSQTKLPATKFGNMWMIKVSDIEAFSKPLVGNPSLRKKAVKRAPRRKA